MKSAAIADAVTVCKQAERIADLEHALGETVLALEYERSRIRQPSVSGATAIANAKRILDRE